MISKNNIILHIKSQEGFNEHELVDQLIDLLSNYFDLKDLEYNTNANETFYYLFLEQDDYSLIELEAELLISRKSISNFYKSTNIFISTIINQYSEFKELRKYLKHKS